VTSVPFMFAILHFCFIASFIIGLAVPDLVLVRFSATKISTSLTRLQ
jgi:hypothetical protein